MADFNDRPFLDLLIAYVGRFGFQRFILCSGHKGGSIKEYFENKNDGKTYAISQEASPLGTAGIDKHAVFNAQPIRPLLLECHHVFGLGEDRLPFEEVDDFIEIVPRDIVFHQWPIQTHHFTQFNSINNCRARFNRSGVPMSSSPAKETGSAK